ncbi:hypothetical protein KUTeg_001114 [Tegillarca granosa]|uniref:Alpha/beta hydrolase fold-3 domain-containing protein n=1 Tax=Tegillarca granosa TaxID=220873 RepID=A0ABQ9FVS2_TEGGR|nr:hypothetical protein KUTeg_001114 [Tegillarca granosa]
MESKGLCKYRVIRNISYICKSTESENDFHEHKFKTDLYLPIQARKDSKTRCRFKSLSDENFNDKRRENIRTRSPVAIFVHGGGWRRGDKDAWKHFVCEDINLIAAFIFRFYRLYGNVGAAMARRGIPCAVMSYPLTRLTSSWIILEIFTSYVSTVLFLAVLFGLILVFGIGFCTLVSLDLFYKILDNLSILPIPLALGKDIFILHLLLSNLCVLTIITLQWHKYQLKRGQIFIVWILIILTYILGKASNFNANNLNSVLFILTLIISQGILIYTNLSSKFTTPKKQISALVQCLSEVRKYGRETNQYDDNSIFLMGHSAGGHLCSLTTLCGQQLLEAGICPTIIKGVIAISAVLDVKNLNKVPINRLYLHPTFGTDKDLWYSLSPINHLKVGSNHVPNFLVVTAQYDFHLKKDASDFCDELARNNCTLKSVTIPKTNHASIMFHFDTNIKGLNLADICSNFICETLAKSS